MSKLLIKKFISIILIIFILCVPALGAPEGFTEVPLQIQDIFPDLKSFPQAFFDDLKPYYFVVKQNDNHHIFISDKPLTLDSWFDFIIYDGETNVSHYDNYSKYFTTDNGESWQESRGYRDGKFYVSSSWALSPRLPVDVPYFTNHDIYYGSHLTPVFETAGFDLELPSTDLFYTGDLFDGLMNGFLFDLFDFGNLFALFGDALLTGIYSVGKTLLSALGLDLDRILNGIVGAVTAVREIIVNSPTAFTGAFLPMLQPLFDPIFDFFSSLFTRIDSIISSLETITLSDLLTGALGGITSFDPVQDILISVFIPSIDNINVDELHDIFLAKFAIVDQVIDVVSVLFVFEPYEGAPTFDITIYGSTFSIVDFSALDYVKQEFDTLIICLAWGRYLITLYKRLPAIIGGFTGK